jgi:hypothetical protein
MPCFRNSLRLSRACAQSAVLAFAALLFATSIAAAPKNQQRELAGTVQSGGIGLAGYRVSLHAAFVDHGPPWKDLGSATTDAGGNFRITYALPPGLADDPSILLVDAQRGASMLASAIGIGANPPAQIVVNERTTVATGNAFAQFVDGDTLRGNTYGMLNALAMAANLANPATGAAGVVLASTPNGAQTSTFATFNSLANAVAGCVASAPNCAALMTAATPPGGARPANVLEAVANIVKHPAYPGYPSNATDPVFLLSLANPVYQPALAARPTSWLLFLKITGGFYTDKASDNLMNGPGNFAIDEQGFVWINDNYIPRPDGEFTCAGERLIKLYPWGENFPGSPYLHGGLSGAGYGITLDPKGNVWIGNFGFQDAPCQFLPIAVKSNSVSAFRADGSPITGPGGYTQGGISWPMATVSDRDGNIWIANCGSDSLTKIPIGNPDRAFNIPLGPPPGTDPQIKPFGVVVDAKGNVWVTANRGNSVYVVSNDGKSVTSLSGTYQGKTVLSHPIGNALDSKGNIWVSNSDWLDAPCPTHDSLGAAANPSVTMFQAKDRTPLPGSPFTGGGLTLPWGIAVDGDDTVWVFNFGNTPPISGPDTPPTAVSRFCGVDAKKCPAGLRTGDPISPSTGYQSDSLQRITGGQIDPSGNVWVTNNWEIHGNPLQNPGGNAVVIMIGAAAPLRTPLIGPPSGF